MMKAMKASHEASVVSLKSQEIHTLEFSVPRAFVCYDVPYYILSITPDASTEIWYIIYYKYMRPST